MIVWFFRRINWAISNELMMRFMEVIIVIFLGVIVVALRVAVNDRRASEQRTAMKIDRTSQQIQDLVKRLEVREAVDKTRDDRSDKK